MALAVKDAARLDHQAGRVNLAGHHALGHNLDPTLGENHAIEMAGNCDVISLDLTFYARAFAQNQAVVREDVAFYGSVQAERSGQLERAFQVNTLIEKARPVARARRGISF